jgi:hypothetical protein
MKQEDPLIGELREIRNELTEIKKALLSITNNLFRVLNPKTTDDRPILMERLKVAKDLTGNATDRRALEEFGRYAHFLCRPNKIFYPPAEGFDPEAQFYDLDIYRWLHTFYPAYKTLQHSKAQQKNKKSS